MKSLYFFTIVFLTNCATPELHIPFKNSNADLSGITTSKGTLTPAFSTGITAYTAVVPYDSTSISVVCTKSDNGSSISPSEKQDLVELQVGIPKTVIFKVTASDNTTVKTYTIEITRAGLNNADLSELKVTAGTLMPAFSPEITEYSVNIPNTTTSLTLTGVATDPNASMDPSTGQIILGSLVAGVEQTAVLKVTAQDGLTVKTYTIHALRAYSSNANLYSISPSVGALSPPFNRDITFYTLSVPSDTATVNIGFSKSDSSATTSTTNSPLTSLAVGVPQTSSITITAPDGITTQTYTITAIRASYTSPNIGNLMLVPAGRFQRDSITTNISIITKPLRMSQNEITRSQFIAIMGTEAATNYQYSTGTDDPAKQINWYQAIAFCNKLSLAEGLSPVYTVTGVNFNTLTHANIPTTNNATWNAVKATLTNNGYRLPSEMEWMWAAMGAPADGRGFEPNRIGYDKGYAGSTETGDLQAKIKDYSWHYMNTSSKSKPVATKLANELGLNDMSGNINEWCWDWWSGYPSGTITDYTGPSTGSYKIFRGGGWYDDSTNGRVASRKMDLPIQKLHTFGIRVVRP